REGASSPWKGEVEHARPKAAARAGWGSLRPTPTTLTSSQASTPADRSDPHPDFASRKSDLPTLDRLGDPDTHERPGRERPGGRGGGHRARLAKQCAGPTQPAPKQSFRSRPHLSPPPRPARTPKKESLPCPSSNASRPPA